METYDIYQLTEDLKNIEDFLLDVIQKDAIIRRNGLSAILHIDSYAETSDALSTLETKLSNFSRLANIVNPIMGAKFDEILKNSDLSRASAEISVSLKIAKRNIDRYSTIDVFFKVISEPINRYFGSTELSSLFLSGSTKIDIKGILIDIERIMPILNSVREEIYDRRENDFEAFKPSNISIENVNVFIHNALSIVSESKNIPPETKGNIEEYLKDIQSELTKDTPAWKNIVGALVIISAILGGLSSAPEALENVRGAIHEILGTSVDEISPQRQENQKQLPNFTIVKKPPDDETKDV